MARLPTPGGDNGNWGTILNDYLSQAHNANGTLKDDSVGSAQLQNDVVTAAQIADGSISENLLDSTVQTKLNQSAPSLSTGSVVFSNGTALTQDNSKFFWDNSNKRLGIGTNSPSVSLHIAGTTFASSQIQSYAVSDSANPVLSLRRARSGTAAIQVNDTIGGVSWRGHDGAGYGTTDAASINITAVDNFTASNHATRMSFIVTPEGSTTSVAPMTLYGDHLDLNYDLVPATNVVHGAIYSSISGKGDNTTYTGVTGGAFQAKDRTDVDTTNKGVLIGIMSSVVPRVTRNNVPADDVNGIMVSNDGTGRATDAIYIARHDSFGGQSEWMTTFTSDADANYGIRLTGTYTTQMLDLGGKLTVDANGSLSMVNQVEPPVPSDGGTLYVQGDALKYKKSSGDITTLSNNGSLVDPKINKISDTNGNPTLEFNTYFTSAITDGSVNYLMLYNRAPGGPPTLSVTGPDTNIGITVTPKGNGTLTLYSPSDTPTIFGAGPASNQNLNLQSNGTGVVQANGIEVLTLSGTQTFTNKTINLSNNTLTGTTAQFNTALSDDNFATITDTISADDLTTGESTFSRKLVSSTSVSSTAGLLRLTYFTAKKTETITQVRTATGATAAAGSTLSRIGVYSVAGNGNLTLIASTVSDTSLWTTTFSAYTKSFSVSFSKVRGVRYALATLIVGASTAPSYNGIISIASESGAGPRISGYLSGQTDLPSNVTAGLITDSGHMAYSVLLP